MKEVEKNDHKNSRLEFVINKIEPSTYYNSENKKTTMSYVLALWQARNIKS